MTKSGWVNGKKLTLVHTLFIVQGVAGLGTLLFLIYFNLHQIERHADVYYHYDFGFFYWAFDIVWHHRPIDWLYNQPLQQAWMKTLGYPLYVSNQYVYPPQFAVLFSWLAAIKFQWAAWVWTALSMLAYVTAFLLLSKVAYRGRKVVPWLFLVSLWVSDYGYYSDWIVGNASWLIFFLLCLTFYLHNHRQKQVWAGVALGMAMVCKVTPVFLLGFYVVRRNWMLLWGAAIGAISATAVTGFIVGWRAVWDYAVGFSRLAATSMQNGPAPYNDSVKGVLMWLSRTRHLSWSPQFIDHLFDVFLAVAAVLIYVCMRRCWGDKRREAALAGLCVVLFSPLTEGTHLLVLLIPFTMVFAVWWDEVMEHSSPIQVRHYGFALLYLTAVTLLTTTGQMLPFATGRQFPLLMFTGYAALAAAVWIQAWRRPQLGVHPSANTPGDQVRPA